MNIICQFYLGLDGLYHFMPIWDWYFNINKIQCFIFPFNCFWKASWGFGFYMLIDRAGNSFPCGPQNFLPKLWVWEVVWFGNVIYLCLLSFVSFAWSTWWNRYTLVYLKPYVFICTLPLFSPCYTQPKSVICNKGNGTCWNILSLSFCCGNNREPKMKSTIFLSSVSWKH